VLPTRTLVRSKRDPAADLEQRGGEGDPDQAGHQREQSAVCTFLDDVAEHELGCQRRDQREHPEEGGERQGSGGVLPRPAQREREQRAEADPSSGQRTDHGDG
jgi:hypothetical protein